MSQYDNDVGQAIRLLKDWVTIAENMRASLPVDPEAVEEMITKSKDFIENV